MDIMQYILDRNTKFQVNPWGKSNQSMHLNAVSSPGSPSFWSWVPFMNYSCYRQCQPQSTHTGEISGLGGEGSITGGPGNLLWASLLFPAKFSSYPEFNDVLFMFSLEEIWLCETSVHFIIISLKLSSNTFPGATAWVTFPPLVVQRIRYLVLKEPFQR